MPLNSKTIAKNTLLLYIRMLLIMAVSLYTTRVVLSSLGVDDYGIFNLIGGFISLFSIISNSLVSAMQRFFNVSLGENDEQKFSRIYSMGINLLGGLSLIFFIIAETIGLWFVSTQLNIPEGRETAALWVYQLSIFTLIVQLFRTPDNAALIAYERMGFFAVLSVIEAVLKLAIAFLISVFSSDKLIFYAILYLLSTIIINIAYRLYCRRKFNSCIYHLLWDKQIYKGMVSFSWWTLVGNGVQLGSLQGENLFLNHYYSVTVNAARGIASQVYNAINVFLASFQTAFKPQLVQTYVSEDKTEHYKLLYRTARMSFFLLLLITTPVLFNMDYLLSIWLKEVPLYTKEFCIFVLFAYLIDALSTPLATSISANGNIKGVQVMLSLVFVLQLLASFLTLRAGVVPYIVSFFILCSHSLIFVLYLYYAHKLSFVSYKIFFKEVILPCSTVFVISMIIPYAIYLLLIEISSIAYIIGTLLWSACIIWFVGIKKDEKTALISFVRKKLNIKHKNSMV